MYSGYSKLGFFKNIVLPMKGAHYSACSLGHKTIAQFHQKCSLMNDCLLFRRLLLPEFIVRVKSKELIGASDRPVLHHGLR